MMHVVKIAQSVKRPRLVLVAVAGLGLVGCNYDGGDPKVQIGANPQLPKLQQYLIRRYRSRELSNGEKKLRRCRRECRSTPWPLALSIQGRSTSSQTGTC